MKTLLLLLILVLGSTLHISATDYSITIIGFTYSPNSLSINSGDKVTISASTFHPLVQVDKATWDSNGNNPLANGWGTKTTSFDFVGFNSDTIYFVCGNHYAMGMKGKIIVHGLIDINKNPFETGRFEFFPNPVTSSAILSITSNQTTSLIIKLFDNDGKQIKDYNSELILTGDIQQTLDFAEINNGIYFLLINENKKEYYKKIVVMK